jgi:hypothetical protein
MENIYSKIKPEVLLHTIVLRDDLAEGRLEVVDANQFIQCAVLNMPTDKTFRPHKHKWRPWSGEVIAQESWVVIRGKVLVYFYDLDDQLIEERVLGPGDASFTLQGGHNYRVLEGPALVYEYKTGPYYGQAADKEFI